MFNFWKQSLPPPRTPPKKEKLVPDLGNKGMMEDDLCYLVKKE